jgi:ABC-type multidrug transport system fused ATPase/permease subunit
MLNKFILGFYKLIGARGFLWQLANIFSGLALTVLEVTLSVFLVLLLKTLHISDSVSVGIPKFLVENFTGPLSLGAGLVFIGFSRAFFQVFTSQSARITEDSVQLRLKSAYFYEVFTLRKSHVSMTEVNTRIHEVFGKASGFCFFVSQTIPFGIQILLLGYLMIKIDPRGSFFGLGSLLIIAIFVKLINSKIQLFSQRQVLGAEKFFLRLSRSVRNFYLLKVLRTDRIEYEELIESLKDYSRSSLRALLLSSVSGSMPQILGLMVVAGMIYLHTDHPRLAGVEFVSFLYLYVRFTQACSSAATTFSNASQLFPQFKLAVQYINSIPIETLGIAFNNSEHSTDLKKNWQTYQTQMLAKEPPAISIKNVEFKYPGSERNALRQTNVTVQPGDAVAIFGPSGSGKSTLLSLLLGIYEPTTGELRIDGDTPEKFFKRSGDSVGYVGAEPFLMDGTLLENLMYGNHREVSEQQIFAGLKLAQLDEWVRTLPEGLCFRVSESGEGMSMGQKQRLSLARALIRNPKLLILDEISANLDLHTESEIASGLDQLRGSCTVIIVSHREGIVKNIPNRLSLSFEAE